MISHNFNNQSKATVDGISLGTVVDYWEQSDWFSGSLRILRPFSWDAKDRGFEVVDLKIFAGSPIILVCGPYAAADAAAWNLDPLNDVGFPESAEFDGVPYLLAGSPATVSDRYQDAAGWFTIEGPQQNGQNRYISVAIDKSNTQLVLVLLKDGFLTLTLILPTQIFDSELGLELLDLPHMLIDSDIGDHLSGEANLRKVIIAAMPERARNYLAPLIVDTWGFGTNVNQELVVSVAKCAEDLGIEILTVDKGWELKVGDWLTNSEFSDGLQGLATIARDRGTRLGLWIALGNADGLSDIAKKHPEWLATWRGKIQVVSHRNHSLCLGHAPVIDYLFKTLAHLAEQGMTWLLHDFETISRCDSKNHDHPPGMGEDWAVRGWYRLLTEFRQHFPDVWIENCWNGGRPLDLQVIAHHDTSIGDDWCDVRHNAVAKVGLGKYLPAHWCSSYMSDQNDLPLRAQLAIYAVGGPWILMGDIPHWSTEKLSLTKRVIAVYKSWRHLFAQGYVCWANLKGWDPDSRWRADQEVLAISFVHPTGSELMACTILEPLRTKEIFWYPRHIGPVMIRDEFSGVEFHLNADEVKKGIALSSTEMQGYLFSASPV
jgi:hypothetical protein